MAVATKSKPLLPTLKENKRYLVFKIISKTNLSDFSAISSELKSTCLRFLGEFGMAKASFKILSDKWNPKQQKGIIRINREALDSIKGALLMVKEIGGHEVIVQTIGVSGTLKKAESKF